ncbi:MAG: hypothetical protein IKV79_01670 [Oscillospiraceae bacterium]|nr:hypothetical protein [Oscillospiraceae bacterium]
MDNIKDSTNAHATELQKAVKKGSSILSEGAAIAKYGIVKAADAVTEKGKEAQMAVIRYVDKKKNARFLSAKLSAFEDGFKAGKICAVDYVKKYANFCLASTALSYYFARCDGTIDEAELLEIEHDLDSIIKNKDLPEALRNKLFQISSKEDLSFEDVCSYLDGVGIETLIEFSKDIDEIIMADECISPAEERAKANFEIYLAKRMEAAK